MNKKQYFNWMTAGGLLCALYVALGAFGAHGLEDKISGDNLDTYHTALRYLIIHALGLIMVNFIFLERSMSSRWYNYLVVGGLLFFSLSLLLHATRGLLGFDFNFFALLAPIGGLSYISAWLVFSFKLIRK